jgi:hypothetical protein
VCSLPGGRLARQNPRSISQPPRCPSRTRTTSRSTGPDHRCRVRRRLPQLADRASRARRALLRRLCHHQRCRRKSQGEGVGLRRCRGARCRGDERLTERNGFGAQPQTQTELFDKLPYPGAPPGTADLYLWKDIFIQNFANDLPPTWRPACGHLSGPPPQRHSTRRLSARPGRRSHRGTSSAAVTRSSRPPRRWPWRNARTHESRCSRVARTSR